MARVHHWWGVNTFALIHSSRETSSSDHRCSAVQHIRYDVRSSTHPSPFCCAHVLPRNCANRQVFEATACTYRTSIVKRRVLADVGGNNPFFTEIPLDRQCRGMFPGDQTALTKGGCISKEEEGLAYRYDLPKRQLYVSGIKL